MCRGALPYRDDNMKITIESTTKTVLIKRYRDDDGIECRVWEGTTESGVKVQCLIPRIAAEKTEDLSQFERELTECKPPSVDVQMFPLRMII